MGRQKKNFAVCWNINVIIDSVGKKKLRPVSWAGRKNFAIS